MTGQPKYDAEIARLTHAGMYGTEIAKRLGITERTVSRSRRRSGLGRPAPRVLTADEIALAEQMFDDGCSRREVERSLGHKPNALIHRFKDRGWTREQVVEYAVLQRKARFIL